MRVEQKMSGIACYCFPLQTKQPFSHHVLAGCHNEPFRVINTHGFYSQYIGFDLYRHAYITVACILDVLKCCSTSQFYNYNFKIVLKVTILRVLSCMFKCVTLNVFV